MRIICTVYLKGENNKVIVLSKDIIIKKRGSIYFGLNMKTGTTYEMNEVGYDIVNFFNDRPKEKQELVNYLLDTYDVTYSEIEDEVNFSLEQFIKYGVLKLL